MLSVIAVDVWQWTPFVFLVLLAGLQAIPEEPYEAARIDGSSNWQTFRHITLPLVEASDSNCVATTHNGSASCI
jgi:multiple sugar transport system permease protein